jgi:hypothetical protein
VYGHIGDRNVLVHTLELPTWLSATAVLAQLGALTGPASTADRQAVVDLRAAAELLEASGWTRQAYYDIETGCHCIVGAVVAVIGAEINAIKPADLNNSSSSTQAWRRFYAAVEMAAWEVTDDDALDEAVVTGWNDVDCQTQEQAVAMLRRAATEAGGS